LRRHSSPLLQQTRLVASIANGSSQTPRIDLVRIEHDARTLGAEVHARGLHARQTQERPFDPCHAGGTGHAADGEIAYARD
jgi:hypothetical protein